MSDSKYIDKNGKPIQEGDVRINSEGVCFLILNDKYIDKDLINGDLDISECKTCELHAFLYKNCELNNTLLIEHIEGNKKERLIKFIEKYYE